MAFLDYQGGNTSSYTLGRGKVFFKGDLPAGLDASGFRDLGNCTDFSIAFESETKEHQRLLDGLKTIDKTVLVSQKMTVSLTLDELNLNNLAMALLGYKGGSAATGTPLLNPQQIASNDALISQPNVFINGLALGVWYDLEIIPAALPTEKRRAYDFQAGQIRSGATKDVRFWNNGTGTRTATAGGTGLIERTSATPNGDYELDRQLGRIRFFSGGPGSVTGGTLCQALVFWAAASGGNAFALDTNLQSVAALSGAQSAGFTGTLRLIQVNPALTVASGLLTPPTEFTFHNVVLTPDGDLGLITDEYATITLTGTAQAVTAPYGLSQYLDVVSKPSFNT